MTTVTELAQRKQLPPPAGRRALRIAAGLTLADVASVVEVTRQTVWRWEQGLRDPRGNHRTAYSKVLGELRNLAIR